MKNDIEKYLSSLDMLSKEECAANQRIGIEWSQNFKVRLLRCKQEFSFIFMNEQKEILSRYREISAKGKKKSMQHRNCREIS